MAKQHHMTERRRRKQKKYNRKWESKNKWRNRQGRYRTTAKTFIRRDYANDKDLYTLLIMCIKHLIQRNEAQKLNQLLNKIDLDDSDTTINKINHIVKKLNPRMSINPK